MAKSDDMTNPDDKPSHAKLQAAARAERLAAELRANLVRRKEKMRSGGRSQDRSSAPPDGAGGDGKPQN
jgi:hypothetical protein